MTITQPAPVLTTQQLADGFARNVRMLSRQVAGLTHADSLLQPPGRGNCLNWVVGHIAVYRDFILEALGEEKILGDAALARYDAGSEPVLGEGEGVMPLETLLAAIERSQGLIAAALTNATAVDLAQQAPTSEPATIAEEICFNYWHEAYHIGQTEFLRLLAETNDQVI
jgi:hypothetical protein